MTAWSDIINIIRIIFETKDCDIAACLEVSPSSLSKVKNGRRPPSDCFLTKRVYRKIFDPTNEKSMVACDPKYRKSSSTKPEDIEKECLNDLKTIIELRFQNVRSDMDDHWNERDYKSFVLELLKLASLSAPLRNPSDYDDEATPTKDALLGGVASEMNIRAECYLQQREPQAVDESLDGTPAVGHSSVAAGGAQLHIEDKYKCCRFCTKWRGIPQDELAICKIFKDQRTATGGSSCKYYEADEGRITTEMICCFLKERNTKGHRD